MRHRIEFILFQIFRYLVLLLPLKSAQRFASMIGSAAFYIVPKRREVALENLRYAFPEKSEGERIAIAKGSFKNYATALVELVWFPNLSDKVLGKLVKTKYLNVILEKYSTGKGLILLSGHFGNWELIALGIAYLSKLPFTIIVQTQNNKLVDAVINKHRCLFGNKIVPMGMSVREIIRTLKEKGVVAIAPDQSGDREGGLYLEFFGRKVSTHQGPAVFALRTGAPLLMGFMIRQSDGTYEVDIEEIRFSDLSGYTEE
ncbi:MAG: hypothetical protein HY800_00315, partial [Ignavibacteriales bacterium]|nr:hypothetical protein [Ignavibacteriales bacterium]